MKVLLETSALGRPGGDRGIGRYVRTVMEALVGRVVIERWAAVASEGLVGDITSLARRQLKVLRNDSVFHAPGPFLSVPHARRSVSSLLDLIPLDAPYGQRSGVKTRVFHGWAARADAVVTLSEYSAERIAERLAVPRRRIFVAPIPPRLSSPSTESLRDLFPGWQEPFALAMADRRIVDYRKRNEWLTTVARQLESDLNLPLVVAGHATVTNPVAGTVGVGPVDDATLAALMQRARIFVNTSAYEGQGLPPMEALHLGTPVVAMRNTSLPEMLGEGALFVEELEPDPAVAAVGPHHASDAGAKALADAAVRVASDDVVRDTLGRAGRKHVQQFTATAFADAHLAAYGLAWRS